MPMTSQVEQLRDWVQSVSHYGVSALVILGPDHHGTARDRVVLAAYPQSLKPDAEMFASSESFGAEWRSSHSPLSGFSNLDGDKSAQVTGILAKGYMSVVRLEFPLTLNRSFECYMLCDRPMQHRDDAAGIVYAMLGAWPMLKMTISEGRHGVSERERESIFFAAEGFTAQQAAVMMSCTERTINFHWSNVVRKLGAENKMAAVQRAIWLGLI